MLQRWFGGSISTDTAATFTFFWILPFCSDSNYVLLIFYKKIHVKIKALCFYFNFVMNIFLLYLLSRHPTLLISIRLI